MCRKYNKKNGGCTVGVSLVECGVESHGRASLYGKEPYSSNVCLHNSLCHFSYSGTNP